MKITMLSEIDYAGSGHKLCEAIRKNTKHDIELYSGVYGNPFGHPDNSKWRRGAVQERINSSDIVHLKGDWPPRNGYLGMNIIHKPIVVSVSGSHFRKKWLGGHGKYSLDDYKRATVRTAFTPDLCYGDFIWTPHPIDSKPEVVQWELKDPPLLMHIPSRPEAKGTDFVFDIFSALKEKRDVETWIMGKMPFGEIIKVRKRATIYFDQFTVGFYGNSAIEAMQYGIPVAAWIRPEAQKHLSGCPIITADKNVKAWVKRICQVLDGDARVKSIQAKFWCDSVHSYESVAEQWDEIYSNIN